MEELIKEIFGNDGLGGMRKAMEIAREKATADELMEKEYEVATLVAGAVAVALDEKEYNRVEYDITTLLNGAMMGLMAVLENIEPRLEDVRLIQQMQIIQSAIIRDIEQIAVKRAVEKITSKEPVEETK